MNAWQVARQLKKLIADQNWTGSSTPVFGASIVTAVLTPESLGLVRFPFIAIRPGAAQSDPLHDEDPNLILQTFLVRLFVCVDNDPLSEATILGGPRSGGQTSSGGRGLLEVEEEMFNAIQQLNDVNGIRIHSRLKSAIDSSVDDALGIIASRDYSFDALLTGDRFYHDATQFSASDAGGGDASLSWTLPADRFDFNSGDPRGGMVLRRASGSTPPASSTAGTGVSISDFATSVTDSPGAGTFSYALFAGYDETGSGSNERFSDGVTDTVTVT